MKLKLRYKLLAVFLIGSLLLTGAVVYLNGVFLPTKLRALVISGLETQTGKKVSLGELKFHILKGLILRHLAIFDDAQTYFSAKEISCTFIILPFKKEIIVPFLNIREPIVFLQRRADNTLNIADLLVGVQTSDTPPFQVAVNKVIITDGQMHFQDSSVTPEFKEGIDNIDAVFWLSLPLRARFKAQGVIANQSAAQLKLIGEYDILKSAFSGSLQANDILLKNFEAYYKPLGISLPQGYLDLSVRIMPSAKQDFYNAAVKGNVEGLIFKKDAYTGEFPSAEFDLDLGYDIASQEIGAVKGSLNLNSASLSGFKPLSDISNLTGKFIVAKDSVSSTRLNLEVSGMPLEAKFLLKDFKSPVVQVEVSTELDFAKAEKLLKEDFAVKIPAQFSGQGDLKLMVRSKIPALDPPEISGTVKIKSLKVIPDQLNNPIEFSQGNLEFRPDYLKWSQAEGIYEKRNFKTNGSLTDFKSPRGELKVSGENISAEVSFSTQDGLLSIKRCEADYLKSHLSLGGDIDITDMRHPDLRLELSGQLDLTDTALIFKPYAKEILTAKPSGLVGFRMSIKGALADLKSSTVGMRLTSNELKIYGLKLSQCVLDYQQAEGVGDIPFAQAFLYGGSLQATGKVNLVSPNIPYWLSVSMDEVKLEQLKLDTPGKDNELSGTLRGNLKLNGFSNDLARLSGAGEIFMKDGVLWELNLFKGIGSLLFTRDFTKIVFTEGYCAFSLQNKHVFSDSVRMRSELANLNGRFDIGFDSSLDAALDVQVSDQAPLSNTFRDVTTFVLGQAGRFGVIRITGTLQEPKISFKADVGDIIKSFKDVFLNGKGQ